jgi:hypothetical protein
MQDSKVWNSPIIAKIAIIIYLAMLMFIIVFGYYILTYIIFLISFIFIVLNFSNIKLFHWFNQRPLTQKIIFIFSIALLLRFLLLIQDQIITRDIVVYVYRSEWMMAGKVPYEEFTVKKPPMYAYMLQSLGYIFGAGEFQFRAFFSIIDSLVGVVFFYLCKIKFNDEFSLKATLAYVICPIPIVAVGLGGHYEPMVMIFVLSSLIFLYRNNHHLSAFLLGIGFALKFFPIVLLPFFAWKQKSWKNRILYIIIFTIPIIITILPIIFMSASAFWGYIYEQTYSWPAKKSFAFIFETLLGSKSIAGIRISLLTTWFFLGLILVMFITWWKKRFNPTFWFKFIVICFVIYYGLLIMASMVFYQSELGLANPILPMVLFALVFFSIIYLLLTKFIFDFQFKPDKKEEMFILSAFSLFFLLFSSSQFNPWYFLWPLPFMLTIQNPRVRYILLLLIFWNLEGIGISLLPGFSLA